MFQLVSVEIFSYCSAHEKSIYSTPCHQVDVDSTKVSTKPSLLQTEETNFSQPISLYHFGQPPKY